MRTFLHKAIISIGKRPFLRFKLRALISDFSLMKLLTLVRPVTRKHPLMEHRVPTAITIVGIGPASLAFVEAIRRFSTVPIHIIADNDLFGGKCVHFGCIVIDIIKNYNRSSPAHVFSAIKLIKNELKTSIYKRLKNMDVEFTFGKVIDIHSDLMFLEDGRSFEYDVCVCATGNVYKIPKTLAFSNIVIPIDEVWDLATGKKILIYSKNNPYAISVASSLMDLGHSVTLLLDGALVNYRTPSLAYALADLVNAGLDLYVGARILRAQDGDVLIETVDQTKLLVVDKVCALSAPTLNLPKFGGKILTSVDIDDYMRVKGEPRLRVIGDASGTFTVTEAEYVAGQVASSILTGAPPKYDLHSFPQKIEARLPLCFSGGLEAATAAIYDWKELDFNILAWSLVRKSRGKLWYLYDSKSEKIVGMHIYHERAVELIAIATVLMKYNITDPIWTEGVTHPSVMEIFPLLISNIINKGS